MPPNYLQFYLLHHKVRTSSLPQDAVADPTPPTVSSPSSKDPSATLSTPETVRPLHPLSSPSLTRSKQTQSVPPSPASPTSSPPPPPTPPAPTVVTPVSVSRGIRVLRRRRLYRPAEQSLGMGRSRARLGSRRGRRRMVWEWFGPSGSWRCWWGWEGWRWGGVEVEVGKNGNFSAGRGGFGAKSWEAHILMPARSRRRSVEAGRKQAELRASRLWSGLASTRRPSELKLDGEGTHSKRRARRSEESLSNEAGRVQQAGGTRANVWSRNRAVGVLLQSFTLRTSEAAQKVVIQSLWTQIEQVLRLEGQLLPRGERSVVGSFDRLELPSFSSSASRDDKQSDFGSRAFWTSRLVKEARSARTQAPSFQRRRGAALAQESHRPARSQMFPALRLQHECVRSALPAPRFSFAHPRHSPQLLVHSHQRLSLDPLPTSAQVPSRSTAPTPLSSCFDPPSTAAPRGPVPISPAEMLPPSGPARTSSQVLEGGRGVEG